MNVLVTGGAGFIGSHLCERLLQAGHAVWAFDDLNSFYDPQIKQANIRDLQAQAKPFEFVYGDLTDADAVKELVQDRKSTRLNSSHTVISYAVFCLKKKKKK